MKVPNCDCIKKTLNQFVEPDGIAQTAEVYYICKNADKGYEERSLFLLSNYCPQCGEKYIEKGN